jgi:transcriptional regulator GlxA family with amidase domain
VIPSSTGEDQSNATSIVSSSVRVKTGSVNPSVFGRAFRAAYGVPPSRYRALVRGG